jgi:hypothetical protein
MKQSKRRSRIEINYYDMVYNNPKVSRFDREEYAKAIRDFIEDEPQGITFNP